MRVSRNRLQSSSKTPHKNVWLLTFCLIILCLLAFIAGAICYRTGQVKEWFSLVRSIRTRKNVSVADPPVLMIDMKMNHFLKLKKKYKQAIADGVLMASGEDFVPAVLRFEGRDLPIKIRLKGDWVDHLSDRDWSYRVKIKKGNAFLGMRIFSLQHPRTRNWDAEWLYHQHLRYENVLSLRYFFVRLYVNGENRGIYAVEENFSKELLESQGRRESVIVKMDETGLWMRRRDMGGTPQAVFQAESGALQSEDYYWAQPDVFRKSTVESSPRLSGLRDAAFELLLAFTEGNLPASKVFKVKKLARFLAVSEIWNAGHAFWWHNLRLYYDPVAARFEPIGFDADAHYGSSYRLWALQHRWTRDALADPAITRAYVAALFRMTTPQYIETLRTHLAEGHRKIMGQFRIEWPTISSNMLDTLSRKQSVISKILSQKEIAVSRSAVETVTDNNGSQKSETIVRVANILRLPVEVVEFRQADGKTVFPKIPENIPVLLAQRKDAEPLRYSTFRFENSRKPRTIVCRIPGSRQMANILIQEQKVSLPVTGFRPETDSLVNTLSRYPFLERAGEPKVLRIKKGNWQVAGDFILPEGYALHVGPGTTLAFAPEAVFVSTGPLIFSGKKGCPVRLVPQKAQWGGLAVLDASLSEWQYVEVSGASEINRPGWKATGGVTFYHSPVMMEYCSFQNSHGEDALNVFGARMDLLKCEFGPCSSDALDGDFVTGTIRQSRFHNIQGDAVDLSGSTVSLTRLKFLSVSDKAVSAGEQSTVRATALDIDNAEFGLVSKDLSHIEVSDSKISNSRIGFAAYIKKPEYGPAAIIARQVSEETVAQKVLVQTGSRIVTDGFQWPEQEVNIDALYAEKVPAR